MTSQGDPAKRKAPYTSMRSLREFLERMRGISVPARVDRKFLQRLGVARNNEWALLSALKFLGIVDDQGSPTNVYRDLQSDQWRTILRGQLVRSYSSLLELGGAEMSTDGLRNYFRVEYSPSQADNATRFFRELSHLCQLRARDTPGRREESPRTSQAQVPPPAAETPGVRAALTSEERILALKEKVLSTLPPPRPEWTADEYKDMYERVLDILRNLDGIG